MATRPHLEVSARALRDSAIDATLQPSSPPKVNYSALRRVIDRQRVNKWDAQILDAEILGLLKVPFRSMFSMFEPGVVEAIKPEIDAVLGALLFIFSTGLHRPTPGMKLENVQYPPESLTQRKVGALFLLSIGLPYTWKRVFRYLSLSTWNSEPEAETPEQSRRSRFLRLMKRIETTVIACQLLNLLVFLKNGVYRSLAERVLSLKMRSIVSTPAPRIINFEYMTRQLLWDGLMEFGSFILPFLTWNRARSGGGVLASSATLNSSECSLCGIQPPQTPYITSCDHVYCYYCLQTAVASDDDYPCAACGTKFTSSQRLQAK